jgi:hypothetical protein
VRKAGGLPATPRSQFVDAASAPGSTHPRPHPHHTGGQLDLGI